MLMEKGHVELGEILFVALLVVGLVAAVILLVDGKGSPSNQASGQENVTQNASPQAPPIQPDAAANKTGNQSQPAGVAAQPPTTNKSVDQLFQDGLDRADSWFYSTAPSGNFDIKTYGWAMGLANDTPDSIPLKENDLRAVNVRFDGRYEDSLRGFTFRQYSSPGLSQPARLYGIAIFLSNSTPLDAANLTFTLQYDPYPRGPQVMEGCKVFNSSAWVTPGGSPLKIYDITCKIMYGVYP